MHAKKVRRVVSMAAALALFCSVTGPQAGTRIKVKGDVDAVVEQVEETFMELEIEKADSARSHQYAVAVGKARSGARVTVSVNPAGEDECEVSVSSDSPEDPDIEARFLRMIQSR